MGAEQMKMDNPYKTEPYNIPTGPPSHWFGDGLNRIIVSAPFGNYLSHPSATSTLGTYTVQNRAGFMRWWLIWRVMRTLRRYRKIGAWVNKLGLPNPGLEHLKHLLLEKPDQWSSDRIVSLHGFEPGEWALLIQEAKHFGAIELNVSCPNVGELSVPPDLFERAVNSGARVIVKLPPVEYWKTMHRAYDSGVRVFHCTNTLPTPSGGLSGKPLKRISLDVIARIKDARPDVTIIGGGGITDPVDIEDYWKVGARHFAVGSAFLRLGTLLNRHDFICRLDQTVAQLIHPNKG